jgi:hypothetical protein
VESPREVFDNMTANFINYVFIDDNTLYSHRSNVIHVMDGDMFFSITVPQNLHDLDFMLDLAQQIINTSEFINVEETLQRIDVETIMEEQRAIRGELS